MSDEHKHECGCGHHHEHEDGHECCCGGHEHHEHECGCGHEHEDGHECCCGGHEHEHEHECGCGCGHEHREVPAFTVKTSGTSFHGFETDGNVTLDDNADTSSYLTKAFESLHVSGMHRDKKMFREMVDAALDSVNVKEEKDRKVLINQVNFLLYTLACTDCDLDEVTPVAADLPGQLLVLAFNNLFMYHMQNNIDMEDDKRYEWHNVLYRLYFMAYRVTYNPEIGQFLLMQHFALAELLFHGGVFDGAYEALTSAIALGEEVITRCAPGNEIFTVMGLSHFYLAVVLANTSGDKSEMKRHCEATLKFFEVADQLQDPNLMAVIDECRKIIADEN